MKKTQAKPKQEEFDDYDDEDDNEVRDAAYYENALVQTINEFSVFVASITRDLETQEKEYMDDLRKKGKKIPKAIWVDSTFKIDFVTKILLQYFGDQRDRLMKYYIIFLLKMKPWITARKEEFFLKANIFPGAPEADIKFFRDLWAIDGTMSDKEKATIWNFWDVQIEIVEDWQAVTGWKVNPNEKLNIPNIDYTGEAKRLGLEL